MGKAIFLNLFYFSFRISQTAPASPTIGRSRATSSSVPSGPGGQVDLDNHTFSESSAAASVGHLGEKVKKTIKQVKKFVKPFVSVRSAVTHKLTCTVALSEDQNKKQYKN